MLLLLIMWPAAACLAQQGASLEPVTAEESFAAFNGIIVGEFHDYDQVPGAKLWLINHITAKQTLDLFIETGTAAAWLYNQYLATGDTNYIVAPNLVYAASPANRRFWDTLYNYYHSGTLKIIVHGFDFERMEFIKVMKLLMPAGTPFPKEIASTLQYIDTASVNKVNSRRLNVTYARIRADVLQHNAAYRRFYAGNYPVIDDLINNPVTYALYDQRDAAMASQILAQVAHDHIAHYLLFAGLNHNNAADPNTLFSRLNNNCDARITNISMVCHGCTSAGKPSNHLYDGPHSYRDDTLLMKHLFERANPLFNKYLLTRSRNYPDTTIKNNAAYLLLIDNPGHGNR